MKRPLIAVSLALAVAVAAPLGAQAQNRDGGWGPGQGYGRHMMGGWGMGGPMMGYGADAYLDRIDGRLAFLKAELKITEEQSKAWDELSTAVRDTAETHNAMMRSMMEDIRDGKIDEMTLPDFLTLRLTHMEARLEQIKAIKGAVDNLYSVLHEDQKQIADEIVLPAVGMGGMMGRGWGMGRGPGWRWQ
ncbi:Spy/CpxP family protein refolding chaperone [Rhizobiales bacterium]|uniref:Spy/CpxP family protein refolding chaperone n=1 Tax=Hongsoonwoonella zoysiae TaxID=2821844 RepID=UPI001561691A|nr:Spy/CpxP family protein refolding chaperone [Hongsoonwoonella zoysiae]NRG18145.1 Spy/CpxP family protein refolding chaperone [Hongsoonwoonella zoysiae]